MLAFGSDRYPPGKGARWLAIFAFLLFRPDELVCRGQLTVSAACSDSTVGDVWGPAFAAQAKRFLSDLQAAVKNNNETQFASLVLYPAFVFEGKSRRQLLAPDDLRQIYKRILTVDLKRAILTQSSDCLFANGQGVMIGRGEIWFQKQPGGKMKIIVFNLDLK